MKKKLRLITYAITFFVGSIVTSIVYHFRFNNELLRKEMILFMQNENSGYFLTFASFDFLFIMFLSIWALIIWRKSLTTKERRR